jgi:hypothetical protein
MWTTKNRPRYDRDKLRYPSDLTDEEWPLVALECSISPLQQFVATTSLRSRPSLAAWPSGHR